MVAILNFAILYSAIFPKTLTQTNSIWLKLIYSHSTWWCQSSWILPSFIQPFWTKKIHSFILTQLDDGSHLEFYHLGFSYFAQKHFTHSFWLNLMMAAILNSTILDSATVILDSDTLLSSFRFTQKHSHSFLTLTQTNSIWLKLIHSHLTWWCQPSWNLPSWIQPFWTKKKFTHSFWLKFMMAAILNSTILDSAILHKNTSLIHSDSSWWWQPSWILPSWIQPLSSWIQTPCYLLSDSLKNTLTPICLWLKLIQSDSNSFILTQLDDVSHLEFCHLGFNHFEQKKTSLIHSHSTLWWQPSWILPSWIQLFCTKTLHLYILTQLDDCSHLEFCHCGFSHCHLEFRHLVIFSEIHSKTLSRHSDSDSN